MNNTNETAKTLNDALAGATFGKAQHRASFVDGFKSGGSDAAPAPFDSRHENAMCYRDGFNAARGSSFKLVRLADYGRGHGRWVLA